MCGTFSFFPSKNLGGFGDAGMVCTNDGELAELVRMLIKHGGKDKYSVDHIGYNARLDTLQAAILVAKLPYVDRLNERRYRVALSYTKALGDITDLVLPRIAPQPQSTVGRVEHVFHQFTIRFLTLIVTAYENTCAGVALTLCPITQCPCTKWRCSGMERAGSAAI